MKFLSVVSVVLTCLSCSLVSAQTTVFSHDFENGTAGDLSAAADLGTPAAGTLSATGGFVSSTRPGWTSGNNGAANEITVVQVGTFNDVGTAAGNYLTATLSEPAAVTGLLEAGETTTVSFDIASFGTSNQTGFKLAHVVGLSSSGDEVFHILWRAGSGFLTREVYAREFGQDNTTFIEDELLVDPVTGEATVLGMFSSLEGTLILGGTNFNISNIDTSAQPGGVVTVSLTIDSSGWNAAATAVGGVPANGAGEVPVTGLSIGSGATDLASIVFFSSHNASVTSQNKGLWVDNVLVETDRTVEGILFVLGDVNRDGVVDFLDIAPFISLLATSQFQAEADVNMDSSVDFLDISPFISILAG